MKVRLGLLAVLCLALAGTASGSFFDIFLETFESNAPGAPVVGNNGWTGDADAAVVTGVVYSLTAGYPVPTATHTRVADVAKPLANNFTNSVEQNVSVDFAVKPVLRDAPPETISNNVQLAMYFDTNGYLTVRHTAGDGSSWSQVWNTLSGTPIGTGEWARVTVAMAYTDDPVHDDTYFAVSLNGVHLSDALGYASPDWSTSSPGPWLLCANTPGLGGIGEKHVSSFSTEGECMLDDVIIAASSHTISPSVNNALGGTITPSSDVVVADGGEQCFLMDPNEFIYVAGAVVDGSFVPASSINSACITVDGDIGDWPAAYIFDDADGDSEGEAQMQRWGAIIENGILYAFFEMSKPIADYASGLNDIRAGLFIDADNQGGPGNTASSLAHNDGQLGPEWAGNVHEGFDINVEWGVNRSHWGEGFNFWGAGDDVGSRQGAVSPSNTAYSGYIIEFSCPVSAIKTQLGLLPDHVTAGDTWKVGARVEASLNEAGPWGGDNSDVVPLIQHTVCYEFTNVTDDHTIQAVFAPVVGPHDVPLLWLEAVGLGVGDLDTDNDGDGMVTWKEYCASTAPEPGYGASSVFEILEQGIDGSGHVYLKWRSDYVDPTLPPFRIEKSTDLVAGWAPASPPTLDRIHDYPYGGENTWTESTVATPGAFYRVIAPCGE